MAQPLGKVQVAIIAPRGDGWLVAVVAHTVLAAALPGARPLRLLPDTLAVPVPDVGWAVSVGADRALVRQADGTGFATPLSALPEFWVAAGSPVVILHGGTLPVPIPATRRAPLPETLDPDLAALLLRGGRRAAAGGRRWLRSVAALMSIAAIARTALLRAAVRALDVLASDRATTLRGALIASGQPPEADPDTALARALANRQPQATGRFLPPMTHALAAIAAVFRQRQHRPGDRRVARPCRAAIRRIRPWRGRA